MSTPVSAAFLRRLYRFTATCSLLKTLPTTTCAICMDDFKCQDVLVRLPARCNHVFHRRCILSWLSRNNTCPLCRTAFPREKPKICSVPLRNLLGILRVRHGSAFSRQPSGAEFRLNFNLRPDQSSSTNSDRPSSIRPLEMMLLAEGLPDLASRASGPFWISIDSNSNGQPAVEVQRPTDTSVNL